MEIISNDKLITRNKKISQTFLIISLAFLGIGFFWSIRNPIERFGSLSYLVLVPAYILVQISIFMSNKWGRSPRPDEILQDALKGLNNEYALINYQTTVPHLLIGPSGLIILNPYYHSGEISFDEKKNEFNQKGGGNFIIKLFGQESLPRVVRESNQLLGDFVKILDKKSVKTDLNPEVVIVFHSEKADVISGNSPIKAMHADKLKNFIRKRAKSTKLSPTQIDMFKDKILRSKDSN